MLKPAIERFLNKINVTPSGCWEWLASKNKNGYSLFQVLPHRYAHRFIYEYYHGEIDPTLTIDHLCRNRCCVNVNHLEQVSIKVNTLRGFSASSINARKTHCPRGHQYDECNTWYAKNGSRICKSCNSARCKRWVANNREHYLNYHRKYQENKRKLI